MLVYNQLIWKFASTLWIFAEIIADFDFVWNFRPPIRQLKPSPQRLPPPRQHPPSQPPHLASAPRCPDSSPRPENGAWSRRHPRVSGGCLIQFRKHSKYRQQFDWRFPAKPKEKIKPPPSFPSVPSPQTCAGWCPRWFRTERGRHAPLSLIGTGSWPPSMRTGAFRLRRDQPGARPDGCWKRGIMAENFLLKNYFFSMI